MSRGPRSKYTSPTAAQQRALAKLTKEWQTAELIEESLNVLDALVKRGLADVKYVMGKTTESSIAYKVK